MTVHPNAPVKVRTRFSYYKGYSTGRIVLKCSISPIRQFEEMDLYDKSLR